MYLVKLKVIVKHACRLISFKQRPWLMSYLDFNANKRRGAKHELERNFFNLIGIDSTGLRN